MERRYVAIVRKARRSHYGVEFPDFPGVVTAGRTMEEAATMAQEALSLHIKGMLEDGDAIPEPTPADKAFAEAEPGERVAFLFVTPEVPSRAVRVNITVDEHLLRAADAEAARRGTSRSGLISELIRDATR
jgi:predicted RNase H-like HicB family nuclease